MNVKKVNQVFLKNMTSYDYYKNSRAPSLSCPVITLNNQRRIDAFAAFEKEKENVIAEFHAIMHHMANPN